MKQSPLNVALLGALVARPGYGYELARRLGELLNPEWNLVNSAVYSALSSLEEQLLIERRKDKGNANPKGRLRERVFFEITPLGQRRWEQMMLAGSTPPPRRDQLVAKLAVARSEDVPALLRQLDEYESDCLRIMRDAGRADDASEHRPSAGSWEEAFRDVMTERLEQHLKAELAWVDHARDRFLPFAGGAGQQRENDDDAPAA